MNLCICPKCKETFMGSRALSGGWLGLWKVFGCPKCRTFFTKAPLELIGIALALPNLLFSGPYLFAHGIQQGEIGRTLTGIVIIFLGWMLLMGNKHIFKKSVRGQEPIHTD
jgi:hypothetical protein